MKITIIASAPEDGEQFSYLELMAENLADANQIVSVSCSQFSKGHPGLFEIIPIKNRSENSLALKIKLNNL